MTTWCVVKDDTGEKRGSGLNPRFLPRFALLACIALVVISLGVALTPVSPKQPGEPPFSEQARAAALAETLRLQAAGEQLGSSASGAGQSSLPQTVMLLTSHARALLSPGQTAPAGETFGTAQASTGASSSPPSPLPDSPAGLGAALAASGSQRLADAAVADGGMARLLAAVGTAQLLQASALAAATGAPAPPQADPVPPQMSGTCQGPTTSSSASSAAPSGASDGGASDGGAATLPAALEAAVRTELQSVYGYQLALTRLVGDPAKAAAGQLARHEALLNGAESLSLRLCVSPPLREAGYTSAPSFLAAPAAGLAGLETAALPVYGDLVALTEGEPRQWAISALLGTARGAAMWGAQPDPLPGLAADPESLPALPPSPGPSRSPAG
jgi:hypothetical protein